MQTISIANLEPKSDRLHGAAVGDRHAQQVRAAIASLPEDKAAVALDFNGIQSATASYLKRLLDPFFAPINDPEGFSREIAPILTNVHSSDLKEELEDFLTGKGRVLIIADRQPTPPKFQAMLGRLDGAARETFRELQELKRATAAELFERHRDDTTNQTAWNNRLVQLVEMRIAHRSRQGRFWIYEPTVQQ